VGGPWRGSKIRAAAAPLAARLLLSAAAAGAIALVTGIATTLTGWIIAWLLAINGTTALSYATDRRAARRGERRVPELVLHGLAAGGGSPAALLACRSLHHKTQKPAFLRVLYATLALQAIAIVAAALLLR